MPLSHWCRPGAAIAALLLLGGCQPGADLPPLPPATVETGYLLDAGDQLRVITFGEQTLTGQFTVEDSGDVSFPLVGAVHARGLTTSALAARLSEELRAKDLLRQPSVSVEIVTYRPVFVLGEVNKPGAYPYMPGMTVLSAVALAGGFTYRAVEDYAQVARNDHGKNVEGRAEQIAPLRPGDVVKVLERYF